MSVCSTGPRLVAQLERRARERAAHDRVRHRRPRPRPAAPRSGTSRCDRDAPPSSTNRNDVQIEVPFAAHVDRDGRDAVDRDTPGAGRRGRDGRRSGRSKDRRSTRQGSPVTTGTPPGPRDHDVSHSADRERHACHCPESTRDRVTLGGARHRVGNRQEVDRVRAHHEVGELRDCRRGRRRRLTRSWPGPCGRRSMHGPGSTGEQLPDSGRSGRTLISFDAARLATLPARKPSAGLASVDVERSPPSSDMR